MEQHADGIRAGLDRLAAGIEEAHAAADLAREGDPTALRELDAVIDAMAHEIAELKGQISSGRL